MYLARYLESTILEASRHFPVVILTGARQVGKTTLLEHLAAAEGRGRQVVALDQYGPLTLAREDPELFFQRHRPPVVLDEVQHVPELLARLKPHLDRDPTPGQYWITGSQVFPLMAKVSESLAGRAAVVSIAGLSFAESRGQRMGPMPFRPDRSAEPAALPLDLAHVFERIVRGFYPGLHRPDAPSLDLFYGSYVQTYIERDVRALIDASNLLQFQRFLRVVGARASQILNSSDLARDVGIAVSTATRWLDVLQATGQVYLLCPYFPNLTKRQTKSPKIYLMDTGLLCYLTGWRNAEVASQGAMAGALFENAVVVELWKSYVHRGREAPLWFYRDKEHNEVDLLIAEDGRLFPMEVKLGASPSRRDLKGVEALHRAGAPLGPGALVCQAPARWPLSDSMDVVNIACIS